MPYPADFSTYQQRRMSEIDRELQAAMQDAYRAIQRAILARDRFIARNLSALWPATDVEYVHRDEDASTKLEQSELSNLILHMKAALLNQGVSPITALQAAPIFNRYAR